VNLRTLARYLIGNADAIRSVATDKNSLWLGIGLVLLTAIARNYDQNFVLETPLWFFGPLLFSLFSGSFLFWILRSFLVKHIMVPVGSEAPPQGSQWRSFMGLFWMTAPVAWLYAIPVERFLMSYNAAVANLCLLAIVAAWRVLLMSRIVQVVNEVPFSRACGWVLVGASLEVIIVVFCGFLTGGGLSRKILAGMAGMRHAPEEQLTMSALGTSWNGAVLLLIVCSVTLYAFKFRGSAAPFPAPVSGSRPARWLLVLPALWITAAIPAQLEQFRFHTHAKLVNAERYADALAYLSHFQRSDFPKSRRIEPDPYEYPVWKRLPPTVALLTTNTPPWIREVYLSHLSVTVRHYFPRFRSAPDVAAMFKAMTNLPGAHDWMRTNEAELTKNVAHLGSFWDENQTNGTARTNLVIALRQLGMSEENVLKLPNVPAKSASTNAAP
jgi:hypothetical protein